MSISHIMVSWNWNWFCFLCKAKYS